MTDLIIYAIPAFVLLLVVEFLSFKLAQHDDEDLVGYESRDTRTSLTMGGGKVLIDLVYAGIAALGYTALYELSPWSIEPGVLAWIALFFLDDFAYYWFHRISHESRLFWGSHVVHHSSQHFNLSTALRQTWVPFTYFPFWAPLALIGFPPWMIVTQQAISLIYQFWIHTERIRLLPRPLEFVLNTPSHHRVHHGANARYLDRNYGGILIVWDRMFGTFEPEGERVRYGLTTNIRTFNPVKVAFHEYQAMARDVRAARNWRERMGYVFKGPGWAPDGRDHRLDEAPAEGPAPPSSLRSTG